ncbi:MAG: pyruvate kinase [Candidatus Micrarchaeota archaeon]|nr:pyruvate kinase [Candidatus Micrarchaeota archaeon]
MINTKIIVTYGPSISSELVLKRVLGYADIMRINFSHGDKKEWLSAVKKVRSCAKQIKKGIALFADLPGPKVRVEKMAAPIILKKGQMITFCCDGGKDTIAVSYKGFHLDAKKGAVIEIGDGDARLHIKQIKGKKVIARALEDGKISSKKGVSMLGVSMRLQSPTPTDMELAKFASKNGFDFVGMSFVNSAKGIRTLRGSNKEIKIIAKIERQEAIRKIEEITNAADVVMVARGDLAEEVSIERIPEVQRKIIEVTRRAGKPVIVATQLLTSMMNNPTPTRAEVNDIASAVGSGVDCLMLSDETTVGRYPEEAVKFLVRTIRAAESAMIYSRDERNSDVTTLRGGIALAAVGLADSYKADCIFIPTKAGTTAKIISMLRPNTQAIALVADHKVGRELAIHYGIRTSTIKRYKNMEEMLKIVKEVAAKNGVKKYIIVSGSPNKPGSTDTLKYIEA